MGYLDSNGLARFYAGLKSRFVRTINGIGPDANGNVAISSSGSVGDPVTDHSFMLDPANWVYPSADLNVYAGQNSFYFVTIPNSLPTDTPYIYYAIDDDNSKALTSELVFANTMSSQATMFGSDYALQTAGEEAAEDKWVFIRRGSQNAIAMHFRIWLFLAHGSNGSGGQTWIGNGVRNGGDLVLDYEGHATVTDAAFTRLSTNLFRLASGTKDNQSIKADTTATIEVSISVPSGYEIVAVRGWRCNNASSNGQYCSSCRIYRVTYSGSTVSFAIKNTNESLVAKIKMEAYVLCAKTHVTS